MENDCRMKTIHYVFRIYFSFTLLFAALFALYCYTPGKLISPLSACLHAHHYNNKTFQTQHTHTPFTVSSIDYRKQPEVYFYVGKTSNKLFNRVLRLRKNNWHFKTMKITKLTLKSILIKVRKIFCTCWCKIKFIIWRKC